MPELPEVQTVVNTLNNQILNKQISSCLLLWDKTSYNTPIDELNKKIKNKKIENVYRAGKNIVIKLTKGFIVFHLRMTGYLFYTENFKINKHTRAILNFIDETFLSYEDIRKFGGFYYLESLDSLNKKLGVDPFSKLFKSHWLIKNLKTKKRQIKSLLLDQSFICGLGNIYIDEILWASKIHPLRKSNSLNRKEINNLYTHLLTILNHSIKHHGTTIINFKFDNMKSGEYKDYLKVYNRENKRCFRCNRKIIKIKISSRSTHLCDNCQR